jgi:nitrite reductase (NADH) large subunit
LTTSSPTIDAWYAAHGVDLRAGVTVTAIDRAAKTVTDTTGTVTSYDKLLLATGSSPFIIPVPGVNLPGVVTYRDLDDVNAMLCRC